MSTVNVSKESLSAAKSKGKTATASTKTSTNTKNYAGISYFDHKGFLIEKGLFTLMVRNVKRSQNTMLLGATGAGKTEMIIAIAEFLEMPITIFDMGTMIDPISGLIGTHTIQAKDGKTYSKFVPSHFSEAIQKPGIILLDEISRATAQANNILFPCLDSRRTLGQEFNFESDFDPIKIHPECVFFSTANTGSEYTGTLKMDAALVNRFMVLRVNELPSESIIEIGVNVTQKRADELGTKAIERNVIAHTVKTYAAINEAYAKMEIDFFLSIRNLKDIWGLVQDGFTPFDSFKLICEGQTREMNDSLSKIISE